MTADTVGGVWTYSLELTRALQPYGVQVTLATMGAPLTPDQWEETSTLDNLQVHESNYKLEWMDDPWQDVQQVGDWLLELQESVLPDIVHLNGYVHGALPWNAPVLMVGHSCVLSWWQAVKGEHAPAYWSRYQQEVKQGLQAADLVVAPTRAMLSQLESYYGPFGNTRVVLNGRRVEDFQVGAKEPFILCMGRLWDEAKNVAALERAAPALKWPVCVAGETQHPDGSRAEHQNLRLLGRLQSSDLMDWLSRAAIYALPARYEPFGLSALEAALSGCALVLGDIPSLREVWGDTALFVPPDDTVALATALDTLIEDDSRRESMAHQACARALQYSACNMAKGYWEAYHDLLNKESTVVIQPNMRVH